MYNIRVYVDFIIEAVKQPCEKNRPPISIHFMVGHDEVYFGGKILNTKNKCSFKPLICVADVLIECLINFSTYIFYLFTRTSISFREHELKIIGCKQVLIRQRRKVSFAFHSTFRELKIRLRVDLPHFSKNYVSFFPRGNFHLCKRVQYGNAGKISVTRCNII